MQIQWSKFFLKVVVWLSAEIALTALGLDNLADYSEFIFRERTNLSTTTVSLAILNYPWDLEKAKTYITGLQKKFNDDGISISFFSHGYLYGSFSYC